MGSNIQNRTFPLSRLARGMYHSTHQNPPAFFILFFTWRDGNGCEKGKNPIRCSFEKYQNEYIRFLSVSLLIDARETKDTRERTKAWTRAIFSRSRDLLELRLVKKQKRFETFDRKDDNNTGDKSFYLETE